MGRLEGKVALVTGAARGLGEAIAKRLVAEGASVLLTDVQVDEGGALAKSLGAKAQFHRHDVSSVEDWNDALAKAESSFGPLSVLVNNAGVAGAVLPLAEYSDDEFWRVVQINQFGVFQGMKAAIPSLRRAGGGSIINISSIAGLVGIPGGVAYAGSKFAVVGMTKVASLELGQYGIRVNAVHPGVFATPLEAALPAADRAKFEAHIKTLPLGRLGRPEELASLVTFLASSDASYCTGASFTADAGWTAA